MIDATIAILIALAAAAVTLVALAHAAVCPYVTRTTRHRALLLQAAAPVVGSVCWLCYGAVLHARVHWAVYAMTRFAATRA
ncbi:hypothetical protein [Agromyces sp. SYSU T00194]|uniref:hypothetical protein n=1 Tax=Agromyces chitinivorans TaxID=3158560 RepID=UPI003393DA32